VRSRVAGIAGLVIALLAGGWLIARPQPDAAADRGRPVAEVSVRDRWPGARIVDTPGRLPDGRAYTPWYHLDAETSVGTALTDDGEQLRLLVRPPAGEPHELMRVPVSTNPQYNGFTADGDTLYWMVSTGDVATPPTLHRADWRAGTPATLLTADTGDVIFYNSQYDLVVAEGRVRWAASRAEAKVTELRSVPVGGGPVQVEPVDGTYALSAWPWLTTAGSSQSGAVELRNLRDGRRIAVPGSPSELVTCAPAWCRVLVLGAAGQPARTDLMRPDGSGRLRMAGGGTAAAVLDVALLDRWEILSVTAPLTGDAPAPAGNLKVIMFDATADRAVVLASGVATVQARGSVVWWSTGDNEATVFHALDLRTLT
jgi:hypothetical protein